ncbi:MAG: carboxymuconolactone decarboxylase family protein [Magnetospirillum gryphiswaldense]|uniref:carboxymuconolactone decarboxylase family protein n=1 Tax=Magnetospirillum sp. 64-120 TaxID=1895778 RepID=UPI0009292B65|nr:carboxymuconolactone decarboxylase family protein [Magnetospirillum sp. 64-120]MBI2242361.1 carboxymuconolactone decarboxylase family protein [Magnetospirillum gryphiswaldense]OJX81749.1 MAG: carboxymuconolactone decarboxylase [Magnetospirillum sp. 64-120]
MSTQNWPDLAKDLSALVGQVRGGIPEVMKGFSAMAKAACADGALDAKTKELVALGIAIAARCDGCITFHTRTARDLGTTREELMEVIGMAVYMGGGPSLMYGGLAVEAYDQHVADKAAE